MPRNFYIGLLVIVAVGIVAVFFYRTETIPPFLQERAGFGGVSLRLEYATTPEAREQGLGGRTEIDEDYGMLFVFPRDGKHGFWMKDMLVPVDIFWLDSKGQVVFIARDVATSTHPNVFYPTEQVRYVLETASGFARGHNIVTGTQLRLKNLPSVSQ